MKEELLVNMWETPDGTLLQSKYVHDYVTHVDKNGDTYMVDGGTEYIRTSVNDEPLKNRCLYSNSPFEEIRKYMCRGTFNSKGHRIWVPLDKMTNEHVKNCITYNENLGHGEDIITECYRKELKYREDNNIYIEVSTYDGIKN